MITTILLWSIGIKLSMPWWFHVLNGISLALKFSSSVRDANLNKKIRKHLNEEVLKAKE